MTKRCSVDGCQKPQRPGSRKPFCKMHEERLRIHGSTDPPPRSWKLDLVKAERIRQLARRGLTHEVIAEAFGCSRPLISMVVAGRLWPRP